MAQTFSSVRLALGLGLALVGCAGAPPGPGPTSSDACVPGQWCWLRGRPVTVDGERARGSVVAFGAAGTFARWDTDHWALTPSPTTRSFTSAWSANASDAWTSDGTGSAWHWDGTRWTEMPADGPILRVLGAPDATPWAIAGGDAGGHGGVTGARLLRRDASGWVEPLPPVTYCIGGDYAFSPDGEMWSAGLVCDDTGRVIAVEVRRFDGSAWQLVGERIPDQDWYPSLVSTAEGMVVDATGHFLWSGSAWIDSPLPLYPQDLGPDQSAAWDGLRYTRYPTALGCEGVFRLDEDHAWCWGAGRVALERAASGTWADTIPNRFDATQDAASWGTIPPTLWAGSDTLHAWGSSPSDVYRVRPSAGWQLEHFDGETWSIVLARRVTDLDGTPDGELWAVTEDGLVRGRGAALVSAMLPSTETYVWRVSVLGDGTVVAITEHEVWSWDGAAWTLLFTSDTTHHAEDAAGTSVRDLWIAERNSGRSNEARMRHADGAGDYPLVDVPGLSVYAELFTSDAATWVSSSGFVARLASTERIDGVPIFAIEGSLWVDDGAVWVTNPTQAAHHTR